MHSLPKECIPAYGSSRSKGGIFQGCAVSNAPNIADRGQASVDDLDGEPTKGKIYLYISNLDPSAVDAS